MQLTHNELVSVRRAVLDREANGDIFSTASRLATLSGLNIDRAHDAIAELLRLGELTMLRGGVYTSAMIQR